MITTTLPVDDGQKLLVAKEAADLLKVHYKTVYRYIETGQLQAIQFPTGAVRVTLQAVIDFGKVHIRSDG